MHLNCLTHLVSPALCLYVPKLFMQKLWQLHIKWDEPLNTTTTEEWAAIIRDIRQLSKLTIERRFFKTSLTMLHYMCLQTPVQEPMVQLPTLPVTMM